MFVLQYQPPSTFKSVPLQQATPGLVGFDQRPNTFLFSNLAISKSYKHSLQPRNSGVSLPARSNSTTFRPFLWSLRTYLSNPRPNSGYSVTLLANSHSVSGVQRTSIQLHSRKKRPCGSRNMLELVTPLRILGCKWVGDVSPY